MRDGVLGERGGFHGEGRGSWGEEFFLGEGGVWGKGLFGERRCLGRCLGGKGRGGEREGRREGVFGSVFGSLWSGGVVGEFWEWLGSFRGGWGVLGWFGSLGPEVKNTFGNLGLDRPKVRKGTGA